MSLEQEIAKLTAAVEANTEAVLAVLAAGGEDTPAPAAKPARGRAAAAAAATEEAPAEPKRGRGRPPKSEPKAPAVSLEEVREILKEHVANFGGEETKKLLAEFNAKKIDNLKPEQYADVIAQAKAEIEAGEDAGGDDDLDL